MRTGRKQGRNSFHLLSFPAVLAEEAALYDRQLRLWGSVAQSRIRQCRVLLAPFASGVAIEVAKNLILAGVKELILLDDGDVSEYSLAAGFVWREEDIGSKVRRSEDTEVVYLADDLCLASGSCSPAIGRIEPARQDHDRR